MDAIKETRLTPSMDKQVSTEARSEMYIIWGLDGHGSYGPDFCL
jgi:hypothetical protein